MEELKEALSNKDELSGELIELQGAVDIAPLDKEMAEERELKEAQSNKDDHSDELNELQEAVDIATLEKEMADLSERLETFQQEYEQLKDRVEELTQYPKILKNIISKGGMEGVAANVIVKQLEQEISILKEAIVRMNELMKEVNDKQQNQFLQKQVKELHNESQGESQICVVPGDAERTRNAKEDTDQLQYHATGRFEDPQWDEESSFSVQRSSSSSQLETLQQENEQLKERVEELTLHLEILKIEINDREMEVASANPQVNQTKQQNSILKETIVRMKELQVIDKQQSQSLQSERDKLLEESQSFYQHTKSSSTHPDDQKDLEGKIKQNESISLTEAEMTRGPIEGIDQPGDFVQHSLKAPIVSTNSSSLQQSIVSSSAAAAQTNPFVSRCLTDFELVLCLGKGGYGVVYQAKHKVDDGQYAIKRILLPNCDEAREKISREAKTLAKLKHKFIVQYHTCWFEDPLDGWLQNNNKKFLEDSTFSNLENEAFPPEELDISGSFGVDFADTSKCHGLQNDSGKDLNYFLKKDPDNGSACGSESSSSISSNELKASFTTSEHSLLFGKLHKCKSEKCTQDTLKAPIYLFILMELCSKDSLKDWLKTNTQRNHSWCLDIFEQIVDAVKYLHKKRMIHRDLKPSNILFSLDGKVKLGDFGLVTASVQEPGDNTMKGKSGFVDATHTGTLYMSPEQRKDQVLSNKADVFSLGLIFFVLFQTFSNNKERYETIREVRKKIFPKEFINKMNLQAKLVEWMLGDIPESRPTAAEICDSDIYKKIGHLADIA